MTLSNEVVPTIGPSFPHTIHSMADLFLLAISFHLIRATLSDVLKARNMPNIVFFIDEMLAFVLLHPNRIILDIRR